MPDRKFTLIEYHSHGNGGKVLENLLSGGETEEAVEPEGTEPTADEGEGRNGLAVLAGLVLLVGIAVAIRRLYREEEPAPVPSEQVEVTEYED